MPTASERAGNWAQGWANRAVQVTWTNHEPASTLKLWYEQYKNAANPPLPATPANATMMVCFELPLYAAVLSGAITAKNLVQLYHTHWADNVGWDKIFKGSWFWNTYNVATHSPTPANGNIVFFNRMAHVAMSTGNALNPGEVVSVWGLDPTGIAANTPVELTTIETLYSTVRQQTARMALPGGIGTGSPLGNVVQDVKVEYTKPPW